MNEQAIPGSKHYWTVNNQWFDDLYTKATWFDRRFRKDVYERWKIARNACAQLQSPRVLDVGCGSGHVALSLVQNGGAAHITGVDFSDTMLRLAEDLFARHGLQNQLSLIKGDITEGALPPTQFDLVIGLGLFDYVKDARKLWLKMAELSKATVVGSFPAPTPIRSTLRRWRYGLKGCPVYFYDRSQVEAVVTAPGWHAEIIPGQAGHFVVARRK